MVYQNKSPLLIIGHKLKLNGNPTWFKSESVIFRSFKLHGSHLWVHVYVQHCPHKDLTCQKASRARTTQAHPERDGTTHGGRHQGGTKGTIPTETSPQGQISCEECCKAAFSCPQPSQVRADKELFTAGFY